MREVRSSGRNYRLYGRASHTFAVLSLLPVTTREPSGLNDADRTYPVCPIRVRTPAPVFASQTFAVLSLLPVTTREPSGLNDAEKTCQISPLRVSRSEWQRRWTYRHSQPRRSARVLPSKASVAGTLFSRHSWWATCMVRP
jgi:hypothetical protein